MSRLWCSILISCEESPVDNHVLVLRNDFFHRHHEIYFMIELKTSLLWEMQCCHRSCVRLCKSQRLHLCRWEFDFVELYVLTSRAFHGTAKLMKTVEAVESTAVVETVKDAAQFFASCKRCRVFASQLRVLKQSWHMPMPAEQNCRRHWDNIETTCPHSNRNIHMHFSHKIIFFQILHAEVLTSTEWCY